MSGNSRIGIGRLEHKRVEEIFAWGKHLVFQLDGFALRVHFLLWGSFAATVNRRTLYVQAAPAALALVLLWLA